MNFFSGLTLIALFVFLIAIGPIFSIMALNALFGTGISLTFGNWFAMMWVHLVVMGARSKSKD